MTMKEWFCEYRFNVGEAKIGGTSITESRLDDIKEWAETVRTKKHGAAEG